MAVMASYAYPGGELELFWHAANWKTYWSQALRPYVRGAVAEVGAGLGGSTGYLCGAEQAPWLCLEPDSALAARLGERIARHDLPRRCAVRCATMADLDAAERFDTILYIDVLEHIADDRGELARAASHLGPGGRIVVMSPALPLLYSPFDAAIGHERRYTARSLAALAPSGTAVEKIFYLDSVGLIASLANRLLLRAAMPSPRQIATWDRLMVPLSRRLDPLLSHRLGKTVVAVFRRG
jgi:hypothetical protein